MVGRICLRDLMKHTGGRKFNDDLWGVILSDFK